MAVDSYNSVMRSLLRTKLFLPRSRTDLLARPQLIKRLDAGRRQKLSLVVAPAGYGKTTLVSTWLQQMNIKRSVARTAWLSLDAGDNDISRFAAYFIAALAQFVPEVETIAERYLWNSEAALNIENLLIDVLNEVAAFEQSIIFVLDDFHVIDNQAIHAAISFWLDHQPPDLHLVITSRREPSLLPLARMRVRRDVTDIDMAALRFSQRETAEFLNHLMQLDIAQSDIEQLEKITEGWVASLQLASISLQHSSDRSAFIRSFKGDNRYIVDYLVSEVLSQQSAEIRHFLLQTSILERFNVQLCNAVTQNASSQQVLEQIDQARLFLIPLDSQRRWYRYHHLFAEYLQNERQRTSDIEADVLHERASRALQAQGLFAEAIHHAFEGQQMGLAATLIGDNARLLLAQSGKPREVWGWIQRLPHQIVQASPALLVVTAWIRLELFAHQRSDLDRVLVSAEKLLTQTDSDDEKVRLQIEIALIRNQLARLRGDLGTALRESARASDLVQAVDSHVLKMITLGSLTLTYFLAGDMPQFIQSAQVQLDAADPSTPVSYARLVLNAYLIHGLYFNGQLALARQQYEVLEPHIDRPNGNGAAVLALSWAVILYEQSQLEQAKEIGVAAIEPLRMLPSMQAIVEAGAVTLAQSYQALGQTKQALDLLANTRRWFTDKKRYAPRARVDAAEALIQLRQNNLSAVERWVRQNQFQPTDEPTYLYEFDYLVYARWLIVTGAYSQALALLSKLEALALAGGRVSRQLVALLLQALAHAASGAQQDAQRQMVAALALGHAGGYVRTIVDEGEGLVPLLRISAENGIHVAYIDQLLAHLGDVQAPSNPAHITPAPSQETFMRNPLTKRERVTLRYLSSDLTIPEIAGQMIVAPSTVRTYIKRIYGKLEVHSRIEAVNRARTLNLLP